MATQLPIRADELGRKSIGFCTPQEDRSLQVMRIPPRRVLPIVFLPGIMGSNLRMSAERQERLRQKNNVAWRPDNLFTTASLATAGPIQRQLQWDPQHTEVDTYDPVTNPTGNKNETSEGRHANPGARSLDDAAHKKSGEQVARERGWTEIYLGSYKKILDICEDHLNKMVVVYDHPYDWWSENILNVNPSEWEASASFKLKPVNRDQLNECAKGCWFPVHAMGYNWLRSNRESGAFIARRIEALIKDYQAKGYQCEKVIVVTHSMGGLVARALIHPEMGNLGQRVLGVVHGVLPAIGAPAAYKRMRCGFDESGLHADPLPKILGNYGSEVTAVLANSPGGLELLPSKQYGNGWLKIRLHGKLVKSLPEQGDPYEEIYKLRGKWYGLLVTKWINPAGLDKNGYERTCRYLDDARKFHDDINSTYHHMSFAHYGSDQSRPSWESVEWGVHTSQWAQYRQVDIDKLVFVSDNAQGKLEFRDVSDPSYARAGTDEVAVVVGGNSGPGDETVPLRSADHQLLSGKFRGVFRQSGYEHQGSYKNENAIKATLYSLIRIIETMKWGAGNG